jgi:hypothetical protein
LTILNRVAGGRHLRFRRLGIETIFNPAIALKPLITGTRPMSVVTLTCMFFGAATSMTHAETRAEARTKLGFYFAASLRNAAFPVRTKAGNTALVLVDFDTGKLRTLGSANSHLMSPYLSPDGERLLFVRQLFDRQGHELVSCELRDLACKRILKTADSISSVVEMSPGRVLFTSSPLFTGPDGQARYSHHDFWVAGQAGEARKLSDLSLYQLDSVSVTGDALYFSAAGSHPDRPVVPRANPLAKKTSDIFKLPFDPAEARITLPSQTMSPLFEIDGSSTLSSVSSDGSFVAFLNTDNHHAVYRYDLVLLNQKTKETRKIESTGTGFSRPVVVGDVAIAREVLSDRYLIKKFIRSAADEKLLAAIDDVTIDASEPLELSITR